MSKKKKIDIDQLQKQVDDLTANVARLEKIDPDDLFSGSRKKSDSGERQRKPKVNEKPDWVKAWNRQNASHGTVRTVAKTTETYIQDKGVVETKTELVEPPVTTEHKRDLETGEVKEVTSAAGLPEHLRLDKLHDHRAPAIAWDSRPEHGTVAPRGLSQREALQYETENPSPPPDSRDEGPTKPMRKQMLRLNKVWKYRNFKKCANCEHYDTWESRTDPYGPGPKPTHAEIWCQTCGSVDFEVADNMPAHIGTWAPPKQSPNEVKMLRARQSYRWNRTIFSLVESPKTAQELTIWFREVEKYEGVDFIMIELMLKRMRAQGLVVLESDGRWWEREDHEFEHPEKYGKKGTK